MMATKVYKTGIVSTVYDIEIAVQPLKIKYLRDFMVEFYLVNESRNVDEDLALGHLVECIRIAMQQYHPDIKTADDVEDNFDIPTMYAILDFAADISVSPKNDSAVVENSQKGGSWNDFDLASLEAEAFLLGIWKDYAELEDSMSLPELLKTIEIKRELEYSEKKFLAAIQGVDLDEQTGKRDAWEEMKARVFSKGQAANADDVLSLQGINAQKAGFGIGMGLDYEKL